MGNARCLSLGGVLHIGVELYSSAELREQATAEFTEPLGPDCQYESLLGDREPPLDYRQ